MAKASIVDIVDKECSLDRMLATMRLRTSRIAHGSNMLLWAQFTSSAQTFFSFSNSLTHFSIYAYPERREYKI